MIRRCMLAVCAFGALLTVAVAQDAYPSRQISLIVPFPPGNAADVAARILADKVATELGKPVVVINRRGLPVRLAPLRSRRRSQTATRCC